jgi:hypothetical protein
MELAAIQKEAFTRTFRNAGNTVMTAVGTTLKGKEPLVNKLNYVFFTDAVSELYGKRVYIHCLDY